MSKFNGKKQHNGTGGKPVSVPTTKTKIPSKAKGLDTKRTKRRFEWKPKHPNNTLSNISFSKLSSREENRRMESMSELPKSVSSCTVEDEKSECKREQSTTKLWGSSVNGDTFSLLWKCLTNDEVKRNNIIEFLDNNKENLLFVPWKGTEAPFNIADEEEFQNYEEDYTERYGSECIILAISKNMPAFLAYDFTSKKLQMLSLNVDRENIDI